MRSTSAASAGIRGTRLKGFEGSKTPSHAQRQGQPNASQTAPLYAAFSATPMPPVRAFERPSGSQAVAFPGQDAPSPFQVFPDFRAQGLARSNVNVPQAQSQAPNVSEAIPIPVGMVTAQAYLKAPGSWLHTGDIGTLKGDEPARRRIEASPTQSSGFGRLDVAASDSRAGQASATSISSENPRIIGRPSVEFPEPVPTGTSQFVDLSNSATTNTWRTSARLSPAPITRQDTGTQSDRIRGTSPKHLAPYPTASPSAINSLPENSISTVGGAPDSGGMFLPDTDHLGATDDSTNSPGELWFDTGALGDWVQTYLASQITRAYKGATQPRP